MTILAEFTLDDPNWRELFQISPKEYIWWQDNFKATSIADRRKIADLFNKHSQNMDFEPFIFLLGYARTLIKNEKFYPVEAIAKAFNAFGYSTISPISFDIETKDQAKKPKKEVLEPATKKRKIDL